MPNYCINSCYFSGSRTDIAALRQKLIRSVASDDLDDAAVGTVDFNGIIPMPDE